MTAVGVLSGAQIILKLHVTDALTGLGLPQAKVRVLVRPGLADWFACPFPVRGLGDGRFVVAAHMRDFAARIRTDVTARFRAEVRLRGYEEFTAQNFMRRSEFKIVDETLQINGAEVTRPKLAGAPFELNAALTPLPVRLQGIVVQDHDPAAPVQGAKVAISGAQPARVTTTADGRFLFRSLPISRSAEVVVTKDAASVTKTHFIDFRQRTNALTLSFETEPTD